jgi:hypothetical protein
MSVGEVACASGDSEAASENVHRRTLEGGGYSNDEEISRRISDGFQTTTKVVNNFCSRSLVIDCRKAPALGAACSSIRPPDLSSSRLFS